ncbi:MAG: sigma-70 family RNA polymerase sigma factor [Candidatus Poribacteria bacterium]|nr:sigma-70 family RNA polymerase sigma factor [Candidatus Poribacteria bacterium]
MTLSDVELIQRTLAGDETAFGFLVDKYKGAVHALAYRKLGDFQLAEEIAQDTFLTAYQKLGTLRNHTHFPGWLYVIASRCCLMWQRKKRPQVHFISEMKTGEMDSLAQRGHAEKQTHQQVHDALESLPESERTVLTLHYFGGMTGKEIAQFIGTSPGAVLNRLYRARARLKEEMIPMIRAISGMIQLPPTFTQQLIRQIRELQPTPSPNGKPLVPWIAATTVVVIALFIGFGQRQMTSFQRPYSLDAPESATMVEIVDAPVIESPTAEQPRLARGPSSNAAKTGSGNQKDEAVLANSMEPPTRARSEYAALKRMNGPYGGPIRSLLVTPEGTVFAGEESHLYQSVNGGESWTQVHTPLEDFPFGSSLTSLTAINDRLYAMGNYVVSSMDGGKSWTSDPRFGEEKDGYCGIAIIKGTLYAGSRERGVLRSNDDGHTWIPMNEGLTDSSDPQSENVPGIGIIPEPMINTFLAAGTTFYVGTESGAYRHKAGADLWEPLYASMIADESAAPKPSNNPAPPFSSVRWLSVDGDTLYLATNMALFRSSNGGTSWKQIPWKKDFPSGLIMSIAAAGDTIYVGVSPRGVFRTNDDGRSWLPSSAGIADSTVHDVEGLDGAVYASGPFNVSRSTDSGKSWETIHNGLPDGTDYNVQQLVVSNGILYSVLNTHAGQIYRWIETTDSWLRVTVDERLKNITSLTVHGTTFYAGTDQNGVLRSLDGGETWVNLGLHGKRINVLAVDGKTILAGTDAEGIFRLKNGRKTWHQLDVDPSIYSARDMVVIGGVLYAAGYVRGTPGPGVPDYLNNSDVLRSLDGGDSWERVNGGLQARQKVTSLAVDNSILYASDGVQIFRLPRESNTWEPVSTRFSRAPPYMQCLAVDGVRLYAGTLGFGVFQVSLDAELEKP